MSPAPSVTAAFWPTRAPHYGESDWRAAFLIGAMLGEGTPVLSFALTNLVPQAAVTAALKRMPGVRKLQSVSGPSDMIAAVEAPNVGEMDALIDEIGALRGVERTNSSIVLATKFDR